MNVTIKAVTGQSVELSTTAETTVAALKQQIATATGMPLELVNLSYNGTPLTDANATLASAGITAGAQIACDNAGALRAGEPLIGKLEKPVDNSPLMR